MAVTPRNWNWVDKKCIRIYQEKNKRILRIQVSENYENILINTSIFYRRIIGPN